MRRLLNLTTSTTTTTRATTNPRWLRSPPLNSLLANGGETISPIPKTTTTRRTFSTSFPSVLQHHDAASQPPSFSSTPELVNKSSSNNNNNSNTTASPVPNSTTSSGEEGKKRRLARRARFDAIKLTDNAVNRIKDLLSHKPEAQGVRLGVRTRGCNGLSYTLDYVLDKEVKPGEDVVETSGVRVVIDPKALIHIIGTTMDYKDDSLASEFVFNNPNAKGSCGCGESFNV